MKLFGRKKDIEAVPAEIQQYYNNERRERNGAAWMLGLGTLLVTIALTAGLFFGGRWVYRQFVDDKKDAGQTTQVTQSPTATPAQPAAPADEQTSSTSTSTPNVNTNTGVAAASTNLPNTGPADVLAIFVAVVMLSTIAHYSYNKR